MRRRLFILLLLVLVCLASSCASGRRYHSGALRFEKVNGVLLQVARDEEGSCYSYLHDSIYKLGTRWHGAQYVSILNGLTCSVNIPGGSWIMYPFQYNDLTGERRLFGIGSGESDLRFSVLWGFLSIGREWNLFWIRGFWFGENDPLFRMKAPEEVREDFKSVVIQPRN